MFRSCADFDCNLALSDLTLRVIGNQFPLPRPKRTLHLGHCPPPKLFISPGIPSLDSALPLPARDKIINSSKSSHVLVRILHLNLI